MMNKFVGGMGVCCFRVWLLRRFFGLGLFLGSFGVLGCDKTVVSSRFLACFGASLASRVRVGSCFGYFCFGRFLGGFVA
jgi:hypothetical protein